jgi:gamma-glutamyltranspeptidase/glutathione hydrolase
MTPPTQGLVSLAILGITDHLDMSQASEVQTIHRIVEATKQAFGLRDRYITDPRHVTLPVQTLLEQAPLQALANSIDEHRAAPWGERARRYRLDGRDG